MPSFNSLLLAIVLLPLGSLAAAPAFDSVKLTPPPPPSTPLADVSWTLPGSSEELAQSGLPVGRQLAGSFLGFSIELSVVDQVLEEAPFLQYLKNIQLRAGRGPKLRIGGNSAEASTFYPDGLASGDLIEKDTSRPKTPLVHFDQKLFDLMKSITSKVGAEWFLGLSFADANDQSNVELVMAASQSSLGDSLLAFQFGNEPDIFNGSAARRTGDYSIQQYETELEAALARIDQGTSSSLTKEDKSKYLIPSVCCQWDPQEIDDAGFLEKFSPVMAALTYEHYPEHDCNGKTTEEIQALFPGYLTHQSVTSYVAPYIASAEKATGMDLDVFMLEYNSASCSGFAGLSTSFGAAIWAADIALALASRKFSTALLHVGGRTSFYNPFTSPPGGQKTMPLWTTGSVYYSTLVVAEALGKSNASQVVDLTGGAANDPKNEFTPAYAIVENGVTTRVVLFNYVSDESGASTYNAIVSGVSGSSVHVRYLRAASVSEQEQIAWAGQTLGTSYASNGIMQGPVNTTTISCASGVCSIPVYAPSIAVVYLSDEALANSTPDQVEAAAPIAGVYTSMSSTKTRTSTVSATPRVGSSVTASFASHRRSLANGLLGSALGAAFIVTYLL